MLDNQLKGQEQREINQRASQDKQTDMLNRQLAIDKTKEVKLSNLRAFTRQQTQKLAHENNFRSLVAKDHELANHQLQNQMDSKHFKLEALKLNNRRHYLDEIQTKSK